MAGFKALVWDQVGEKKYHTGTKKGVLYPQASDGTYEAGVAWNGLTGITESPSGADETPLYADDDKYLSLYSKEEFGGTINAYMYPDEWEACDGSKELIPGVKAGQQSRKSFGLSYVTTVGNDTKKDKYGYLIHLVYGATASVSERGYETINDSPNANTFSWNFTTVPVDTGDPEMNKTSIITIDSTKVDPQKLKDFEKVIYGSDEAAARLPLPSELKTLLASA